MFALATDSFVGREQEARDIRRLLNAASSPSDPDCPASRLITLTAMAGVGKTVWPCRSRQQHKARSGTEPASFPLQTYPIPAGSCRPLGPASGSKKPGTGRWMTRLRRFLQPRHLLLVIDNFEQVIRAAPQLEELLADCPRLVLLVTSREILHLPAEREFPVRPLPLPSLRRLPGVESLARYAGVALFVERAQAATPAFRLTEENAPAVARICHDLEGLPLAIELAAARVKVLSVSQIATRLTDRFTLLVKTGPSPGAQRHRTLRAALDWSYDLLSSAGAGFVPSPGNLRGRLHAGSG